MTEPTTPPGTVPLFMCPKCYYGFDHIGHDQTCGVDHSVPHERAPELCWCGCFQMGFRVLDPTTFSYTGGSPGKEY